MSEKSEQSLVETADPTEIAGPDECSSTVVGSSIGVEEILSAEEDVSFPISAEIEEAFVAEPIPVAIDPKDGLPRPIDDFDNSLPVAPPFNRQSLVCMEDDTEFVEVFEGELDEVRCHDEDPSLIFAFRPEYDDNGVKAERRRFKPSEVNGERWGIRTVEEKLEKAHPADPLEQTRVTFVSPIRMQCDHYVRTVVCHDPSTPFGQIGHEMMYRNCTARRSVGGALMSLNSEAVYACELRRPRDLRSEERHIRIPDQRRLTQVVEQVPLFNLQPK